MIGNTYRLKQPLLGIEKSPDGRHAPVTVPVDNLVVVVAGPLNGSRLVEALFNGKTILMFTQDIREYAEPIAMAHRRRKS